MISKEQLLHIVSVCPDKMPSEKELKDLYECHLRQCKHPKEEDEYWQRVTNRVNDIIRKK